MSHRSSVWSKVPTAYSCYCDLIWSPLAGHIDFQKCQDKHQIVNHMEFHVEISNKMRLYVNLLRHCEEKKIDLYSIFPFTICLQISHRSFSDQMESFKTLFNTIEKFTPKSNVKFIDMFNVILSKRIGSMQTINIPKTFNSGKNMWIIKPVNCNQGRFITVQNDLQSIIQNMSNIQQNKKIRKEKNNSQASNLNTISNINITKSPNNNSNKRQNIIVIFCYKC